MKIKYIFKSGRKNRINSLKNFPNEFFYGYPYLIENGFDVEIIEENDLKIHNNTILISYINKFLNLFLDFPLLHFVKLLNKKNLTLLNNADILITTTNSVGLSLGLLKNLNLIKKPIIFIAMGLIPLKNNFLKISYYKFLLQNLNVICLSINEQKYLISKLKNNKISYLPFGVDMKYWRPKKSISNKGYILAIGNDYARDWKTLIDAWDIDFPELKLVTSLPLKTKKKNITILKGSWGEEFLTDDQIRKLYLDSYFVVIPLKQSIQPSGQSCCLQAMSCGKPVIMTKIMGIWDENLLKNEEDIIFVPPYSTNKLKKAIKELLTNKTLYRSLSLKGKKLIKEYYNSELMSKSLLGSITDAISN